MSIEKIAAYFKGCVVFCAEGLFCERFLNICMRREIFLWDVRRMGQDKIYASVGIGDFHRLREIARKTKTHVSIKKRRGLPFLLHRYRKRKPALLGILVFFLLLWYLSGHIMGIDVTGNNRIATEEILESLKGYGLYHGAAVDKIDSKLIKNRMMTSFDDIAWIGVSIKGSRAYIEVKERLDTKVELDRDVPCDIVAEISGTVQLLDVKNGQTVVKVNQYVEEGDLLVSGVVDSEKVGIRYVHSFGEVFAEVSYKKTGDYSFEYTDKIYTGKEKTRYTLSALGKALPLFFKNTQPFEYCDRETEKNEYRAPVSFVPSLFVEKERFSEYIPQKKTRSLQETVDFAAAELEALLAEEIPEKAEIAHKKVTYSEIGKKGVSVTVEYLCRQDIAVQRKIDKVEVLGYDMLEEE